MPDRSGYRFLIVWTNLKSIVKALRRQPQIPRSRSQRLSAVCDRATLSGPRKTPVVPDDDEAIYSEARFWAEAVQAAKIDLLGLSG